MALIETSAEVLYDQPISATYNEEAYVVEGLPKTVDITLIGRKSDVFKWTEAFYDELKHRRKFALRMGRLSEAPQYVLKEDVLKKLFRGDKKFSELTEDDLRLNAKQKGVDMRIGIDITSLALKKTS